jgi:SAM-dependent methyltransferase
MQKNFPLFQSHLDLAHDYWERLLQNGDWAIDATCGAGRDTLMLAKILQKRGNGGIIGIDIQEESILRTRELLQTNLPPDVLSKIHLHRQSHHDFPPIAAQSPIKLVVYNLGYLPQGNKQLTTLAQSTLESVQRALKLLLPGGALSITCYPGHPEGAIEERALLKITATLSSSTWNVCHHSFLNRTSSPSLILIQKVIPSSMNR